MCVIKDTNGQQIIKEGTSTDSAHATVLAADLKRRQPTSRKPRPASKGDGALWHARMGHPGPGALHMLGIKCLGVDLRGPPTSGCIYCAQAKIPRQISRRPPDRKLEWPCQEIYIDWSNLEKAYDSFVRVMFITDRFSGMVFPYFMSTHGTEKENLRALKDFVSWIKKRYGLEVKVVKSDNKLGRKQTLRWLRKEGITFKPLAPRT